MGVGAFRACALTGMSRNNGGSRAKMMYSVCGQSPPFPTCRADGQVLACQLRRKEQKYETLLEAFTLLTVTH